MKHAFVIVLFNLVIFYCMTASSFAHGLGVRIGMNYGNASTNPPLVVGSQAGLMIGGIAEIDLTSTLILQGEAFYAEKKAEIDTIIPGVGKGEEDRKYKYIEFPVTLKVKFGRGESVPYLFAGPNLGINISAKSVTKINGQKTKTDLEEFTEEIDIALDIGGGAEYPLVNKISLLFDIRYSIGLFDIDKTSQSWRTNGVQIILGAVARL